MDVELSYAAFLKLLFIFSNSSIILYPNAEFKAGLDSGLITVAEVGEIKKELAYHGDVLNSASRIQGMCNQYQSNILLSERLKDQFNGNKERGFDLIGNIHLKGRSKTMNVYRIIIESHL